MQTKIIIIPKSIKFNISSKKINLKKYKEAVFLKERNIQWMKH